MMGEKGCLQGAVLIPPEIPPFSVGLGARVGLLQAFSLGSHALWHALLCPPAPQTCPRSKHGTSLNPNYVTCDPTVGQEGGAWSLTQEWGQKAAAG